MKPNIQPLVEGNMVFALDLYSRLGVTTANLCISPFSVATALVMTLAGAHKATEKQMKAVLRTPFSQAEIHLGFASLLKRINAIGKEHNIELLLANTIYPHDRYALLESFMVCLKENYDANIYPLDYSRPETAREFINQWVNEKTEGHISELIPAGLLDSLTRLVLVNAMYFKGFWDKPFDKQATIESPFWVLRDFAVGVPTMCRKAGFGYMEDDLVQVLELPYQGNNLSLVIILPKERLASVERHLTPENLSKWLAGLRHETIDVRLPSFKITSKFNLNETLALMGMPDAFDINKADFSGMDDMKYPDGLFIKNVFHQADIEVSEEGTTAAATTAVAMAIRGLPQAFEFHANHPFIFLLRENTTGSVLFIGKVMNPSAI